jgi:two-component system, NarL family, response regulator NreC
VPDHGSKIAHRAGVLILDLNMPGGSSLEAIPEIREEAPTTAIVVLTMQNDPAFARQALQSGAAGFVLKESADDELLEAIRLAAGGGTYLNPSVGARLAAQPPEPAGPPDDLSKPWTSSSPAAASPASRACWLCTASCGTACA